MRKRQKEKKHSCKMCKPHKMGWSNRWTPKESERLQRDEKSMRQAVRRARSGDSE